MKNPDLVIVALSASGNIVLTVLLAILNSVVCVDPAPVFIFIFVAIIGLGPLWNRWEGERQRQRINTESRLML